VRVGSPIPGAWIDGCIAAQRRLEGSIENLTDDVARRPIPLEGWTVGHLLTHLARNADSHRGMFEAAQHGDMIWQYPGGYEQREGDIAAGAGRPASELIADVREANQRLADAWAAATEDVWATGLGMRGKGPTTLPDLVALRWREVEVHLVDLSLPELSTPDWDGLSPAYVDLEWQLLLPGLPGRLPEGVTLLLVPEDRPSRAFGNGEEQVVVRAPATQILGWLFGRVGEREWPKLGPWS
jgi:maleylpyruvate isomerase